LSVMITKPPQDFKPDFKNGTAWCPYCGKAQPFVWDAHTRYACCPECGISAEDFHARTCNGFWNPDAKDRFDGVVKDSGRRYTREAQEMEQEPLKLPTWLAPAEKMPWADVFCPGCGRYIRSAYPPTRERCFSCGGRVIVDCDGSVSFEPQENAVRCGRCGKFLTGDPRPGAAYWCERCGAWFAADKTAEKEAEEAKKMQGKKARRSLLPVSVLAKVRALAAQECAGYQASGPSGRKHYCLREPGGDNTCVFFGNTLHRCTWFEQDVLPLDPVTEEAYWRKYGQVAEGAAGGDQAEQARKAAREARKALKEAREKREKICAFCKKPFVPEPGKEKGKYCSDTCRRMAERDQARARKQRSRERNRAAG